MIRFEYDPQLVEQATFLAARNDTTRECALHETLDPLYAIPDRELRQREFRIAYGRLFHLNGLDRIIPAYTAAFPHINRYLTRCLIREAERARAQIIDLYNDKTGDTSAQILIIALCPDFLLNPTRLAPWMYRQLQHVEDMLDSGFAYDRTLPGVSTAQQNLIRDRYAALWDTYVEGRLIRAGKIDDQGIERLWQSFCRAFTYAGQSPSRLEFDELLNSNDRTHAQLISWAAGDALQNGILEGGGNEHSAEKDLCKVA